jgi:hypothetical protein
MDIPSTILSDFKAFNPMGFYDIKTKVLEFEGVTSQTRYVFYYCGDFWHIQPLLQLCFRDWEERMILLNKTIFSKHDLVTLPATLVDNLDLTSVDFHYQGGWDKISCEVFGIKTFPKTREEMNAACKTLEVEAHIFLLEMRDIHDSYLKINTDTSTAWMNAHAKRLIGRHVRLMQAEKRRLTGKRSTALKRV